MKIFDLHCDTVTYCCEKNLSLNNNFSQLALGRIENIWYQTFAIFMPDELRGQAAFDYFERNFNYFRQELEVNDSLIEPVVHRNQFLNNTKKCKAILSVEGGSVIGEDLTRIKYLADCGVKLLTLTWNGENNIAGGIASNVGLKPFGIEAICEMEKQNIIVDVSHLNDKSFDGVVATAKKPFVATHSNARAVQNHKRNLTDDQFKEIVKRKGIVGINFYKLFIDAAEEPTIDRLIAHIEHFLALGGENTIALGSDFDGADMPAFLPNIQSIGVLYTAMQQKGLQKYADKLFFENAYRFFNDYVFSM